MDIHNYIAPNAKEAQPLHYANNSSDDQQFHPTSSNNNNFESTTRRSVTTATTVPPPSTTTASSILSSIPENEPANVTSTTIPSITTQDMSNSHNRNNGNTSQGSNEDITTANNEEVFDPALLLTRFDKRKSSPAVLGLLPGLDQDQLAMHLSQQRNSIEAAMLLANLNKITTTATPPQVSCKTEQKGKYKLIMKQTKCLFYFIWKYKEKKKKIF